MTAGSRRKELILLKITKDALKSINIYEVLKRSSVYLFKYFTYFVKVTSGNKGLSRWPLVENSRNPLS